MTNAGLASFIQAAIAADEAWMRANDQAQLEALRRGDKAEWKRLFDEKGERLSAAKGNMVSYLEKYYPHLRGSGARPFADRQLRD